MSQPSQGRNVPGPAGCPSTLQPAPASAAFVTARWQLGEHALADLLRSLPQQPSKDDADDFYTGLALACEVSGTPFGDATARLLLPANSTFPGGAVPGILLREVLACVENSTVLLLKKCPLVRGGAGGGAAPRTATLLVSRDSIVESWPEGDEEDAKEELSRLLQRGGRAGAASQQAQAQSQAQREPTARRDEPPPRAQKEPRVEPRDSQR